MAATNDDLHAAIANYLRRHNRRILAPCPPPVPLASVRCQVCGHPVDDDGGLFNLADMQLRRQCERHYAPF